MQKIQLEILTDNCPQYDTRLRYIDIHGDTYRWNEWSGSWFRRDGANSPTDRKSYYSNEKEMRKYGARPLIVVSE